jgi:CDP-diacylglycerol--inositol 3-phosphatidyltransferase
MSSTLTLLTELLLNVSPSNKEVSKIQVLYIVLFLFADEKSTSLLNVCGNLLKQSPLTVFVFISTLVGWALKQVINVIQMKSAADACVVFDLKRGK